MKEFESERSTRYRSLAVHQHRSEREEKKTEMGEGGYVWWGKNKKKGREGGYVGGGKIKEIKNKK